MISDHRASNPGIRVLPETGIAVNGREGDQKLSLHRQLQRGVRMQIKTKAEREPPGAIRHSKFPSGKAGSVVELSPSGGNASALNEAESNASSREDILIEHLPLVRLVARRIHEGLPSYILLDDLYSAGIVGLIDAVAKYDSTKQSKFGSYARFRIRGAILDSLRDLDYCPRALRRKGRALEQARDTLTTQLGRYPETLELVEALCTDLHSYQQLLGQLYTAKIALLDSDLSSSSGEEPDQGLDGLPSKEDDPLRRYLRAEMEQELTEAIGGLPQRERLVVKLYYYDELSRSEISAILGVVESRVSQIHSSAIFHLRSMLAQRCAALCYS
jgi:RNA polymerase sigma factor FliA